MISKKNFKVICLSLLIILATGCSFMAQTPEDILLEEKKMLIDEINETMEKSISYLSNKEINIPANGKETFDLDFKDSFFGDIKCRIDTNYNLNIDMLKDISMNMTVAEILNKINFNTSLSGVLETKDQQDKSKIEFSMDIIIKNGALYIKLNNFSSKGKFEINKPVVSFINDNINKWVQADIVNELSNTPFANMSPNNIIEIIPLEDEKIMAKNIIKEIFEPETVQRDNANLLKLYLDKVWLNTDIFEVKMDKVFNSDLGDTYDLVITKESMINIIDAHIKFIEESYENIKNLSPVFSKRDKESIINDLKEIKSQIEENKDLTEYLFKGTFKDNRLKILQYRYDNYEDKGKNFVDFIYKLTDETRSITGNFRFLDEEKGSISFNIDSEWENLKREKNKIKVDIDIKDFLKIKGVINSYTKDIFEDNMTSNCDGNIKIDSLPDNEFGIKEGLIKFDSLSNKENTKFRMNLEATPADIIDIKINFSSIKDNIITELKGIFTHPKGKADFSIKDETKGNNNFEDINIPENTEDIKVLIQKYLTFQLDQSGEIK